MAYTETPMVLNSSQYVYSIRLCFRFGITNHRKKERKKGQKMYSETQLEEAHNCLIYLPGQKKERNEARKKEKK